MTKTVHAIRHGGNLELLEPIPIDIPEGTKVTVTVDLPVVVRPPPRQCSRFAVSAP